SVVDPVACLGFCLRCVLSSARSTLFPYTTLFRSHPLLDERVAHPATHRDAAVLGDDLRHGRGGDEVVDDRRAGVPTHLAYCHERSEEHTSELQSREKLVCRLLLEKKKY